MSNILDKIAADKRRHVVRCKQKMPVAKLEERAKAAPAPRGFYNSLRQARQDGRFGLITEIKKASPSKGVIRRDFNPPALARAYAGGGAACLSVLTDEPYFQGCTEDLIAARAACSLPVLRKDFTLDPYQIIEARAMGADCILLIMALLDDVQATELELLAIRLGLDVLVESHDEDELERALMLKSPLMGINNRNLKTFELSLDVTLRLAKMVGSDRIIVSESGIFRHDDLAMLADNAGVNSFLIGESLMREKDIARATRQLTGENND